MKVSNFSLSLTLALACAAVCAQAQTYTDFANFDGTNGAGSDASLIQAPDGNFYGASGADTFGTIFRVTPSGEISAIYKFCSQPDCADGDDPIWGPVLGATEISTAWQSLVAAQPVPNLARGRFTR